MYRNDLSGVIVYCTIRHLRQLIAETCGIGGSDFAVRQRQHQLLPQVAVFLMLRFGKLHGVFAHDQFRHFQVVGRSHGNRDVGYLFVYRIFRTGQRLIAVHNHAVPLIRLKVGIAVLPDKTSKPLSHIQKAELRIQVHESVSCRRTRQSHDALCLRSCLHESLEAFCLVVFEGTQFINDDHIKIERHLIYQPADILAVDDIDIRLPGQCRFALFRCADCDAVCQPSQVIPFLNFLRPHPCYTDRGYHENSADLKAVEQQVIDGGQRDARFSKSHRQQQCCNGMVFYKIRSISLIIMRSVSHQSSLRSEKYRQAHTP